MFLVLDVQIHSLTIFVTTTKQSQTIWTSL